MVFDVSIENLTRRGLEDGTVVRRVPVVFYYYACDVEGDRGRQLSTPNLLLYADWTPAILLTDVENRKGRKGRRKVVHAPRKNGTR